MVVEEVDGCLVLIGFIIIRLFLVRIIELDFVLLLIWVVLCFGGIDRVGGENGEVEIFDFSWGFKIFFFFLGL